MCTAAAPQTACNCDDARSSFLNTCLNGGICMSNNLMSFSCLCPAAATGAQCQTSKYTMLWRKSFFNKHDLTAFTYMWKFCKGVWGFIHMVLPLCKCITTASVDSSRIFWLFWLVSIWVGQCLRITYDHRVKMNSFVRAGVQPLHV